MLPPAPPPSRCRDPQIRSLLHPPARGAPSAVPDPPKLPLCGPRNWGDHLGGLPGTGGRPARMWGGCHRVTGTLCGGEGTTREQHGHGGGVGGIVTMGGHPEVGAWPQMGSQQGHPRHRDGDRRGQEGTVPTESLCTVPRLGDFRCLDVTPPIPPSPVSCSNPSHPPPVPPKAPRPQPPAPPDQGHPIPSKLINSH